MNSPLACEQVVDGRWIAEVAELPGVLSWGDSAAGKISRPERLVLRVLVDQLDNNESEPVSLSLSLPVNV
ncbi:MAG: type II toxin-antitoxin system HicB family antitoxin [Synechococcaceae cyanobacterium]|jgi:predicted RNase H-like HicB family nuclease